MAGLLQSNVPNLSGAVSSATGSSAAETCNAQAGIITTEALTTASGAVSTRTLTNSTITAASIVMVGIMGSSGSGGQNSTVLAVTCIVSAVAAGSATVKIANLSGSALNGTVVYWFLVL